MGISCDAPMTRLAPQAAQRFFRDGFDAPTLPDGLSLWWEDVVDLSLSASLRPSELSPFEATICCEQRDAAHDFFTRALPPLRRTNVEVSAPYDLSAADEPDLAELMSSVSSSGLLRSVCHLDVINEISESQESQSVSQLHRKPWYQRMFEALLATQASLQDEMKLRQEFEAASSTLFLRAQRSSEQLRVLSAELLLRRSFCVWRAQAQSKALSTNKHIEKPSPDLKRKRRRVRKVRSSMAAPRKNGMSCDCRTQAQAAFIAWSRLAMVRHTMENVQQAFAKHSWRCVQRKELQMLVSEWQRATLNGQLATCKKKKELYFQEMQKVSRILTDQQLSRNPAVVGCTCGKANHLRS